jgi:CubicO group peptidase (beta-lactamase class C family)
VKLISRKSLVAFAASVAFAAALGACSSVTVNTDWNSAIDFSQYKTFAWLPDTVDKNLPPFAQERLTTAITGELVKRGLKQVTADPELYVTFRATRDARTQYTTVSSGYGYGYGYGWGGWGGYGGGMGVSTTSQQVIPTGNLIVVLVDPKINQMVWRGNASADLSDDAGERMQQLKEAMSQMFGEFPPKKGAIPGATQY